MKGFLVVSFFIVAVSASLLEQDGTKFQAFKLEHGKTYQNQAEETQRFAIFRENLRSIESHNARYEQGLESYFEGTNQFADMTHDEFKDMLALQAAGKPAFSADTVFELPEGATVPDSIDWRDQNAVAPIKNQGWCGSCWAFAIIASTEGAYAIKTGNLTRFSEQQLVDCTTDVNIGCSGGDLEITFPYIQENGVESEEDYPYEEKDASCRYDSSKVVTKISSYVGFNSSEDTLKEAVGTAGPVAVAIDADYIMFYKGGIFDNVKCNSSLEAIDHGVTIIGYGNANATDYWIGKNSWGTQWGESGFFKMLRGVNLCGVVSENTYPII